MVRRRAGHFCRRIYGSWRPFTCVTNVWSSGYAGMTLSETQKLSTGPTFPLFGMSSPRDETHCSVMWWDSMTTRQPTAHRSQQQELATALSLVNVFHQTNVEAVMGIVNISSTNLWRHLFLIAHHVCASRHGVLAPTILYTFGNTSRDLGSWMDQH